MVRSKLMEIKSLVITRVINFTESSMRSRLLLRSISSCHSMTLLPDSALMAQNLVPCRDPFEDMSSFGSRTTPVGFYNGQVYDGYQTTDSASPYGLYDMSGNVWQWTGDVYEGQHYRYMRGGSKDTYDMDLRIWVRNNTTPTYFSPGVGFRCVRGGE